MNKKGPLYALFLSLILLLPGCSSIAVLNPKGPAARTLSDTIILSIVMMLGVLAVVYILYVFVLLKYRAKKATKIIFLLTRKETNGWRLSGLPFRLLSWHSSP